MALTPEAMQANPAPPNPSGHHDPMPGPAIDVELFDGAPRVWTIYPDPQPPYKQVMPAGMWPFESPVAKAARAEAGEDPTEPPHDYAQIIDDLIMFPFGKPSEEKAEAKAQTAEAARHADQRATSHANTRAATQHPPAAQQL